MAKFEEYSAIIFWDFARMDNVNDNFKTIESLIDHAHVNPTAKHLHKPIFIAMMSIIECVLYDLIQRAKDIVHEHIDVSEKELDEIKNKDVHDKLQCYTDICIKHKLLGNDTELHKKIYEYIPIRNRVHIQNTKDIPPKKEWDLWDAALTKSCGELLKSIMIYTCTVIPRPEQFHNSPSMHEFPSPWDKL